MGVLFSVLHDTIVDARRGRSKHEARKVFDYHCSVPDITRPAYSTRHNILRKSESRLYLMILCNLAVSCNECYHALTCIRLSIAPGWRSCTAFPLNHLDDDRRASGLTCFTFAFDESGLLNSGLEPAFYRRTQHLEKACDSFEYCLFILDTRFGLMTCTLSRKTIQS